MNQDLELLNPDLAKHRRNLMLISTAILVYELAGGKVTGLSTMNVGLTFSKPGVVIYVAYIALFYFLWRFWVYAQGKHKSLTTDFDLALKKQKIYINVINPLVFNFRRDSGIEQDEAFQEAVAQTRLPQKPVPQYRVAELKVSVRKGFFKRFLLITATDPDGRFNFDPPQELQLNYFIFELSWLRAFLIAVLNKKAFSDLVIPYMMVVVVIAVKCWKLHIS